VSFIEVGPDIRDRNVAIQEIKKALKARSGKSWSVRGGRGTAWGWISISALPGRCNQFGHMTESEREELARLLNLKYVDQAGVSVAADGNYREEYVARARGAEPRVIGTPYWD
jgi:hypothetical protein